MEVVLALIIARFIVNGTVDVVSMITGNQPPSKTYHDARGDNREDGPLTRMIKAWWEDAMEDIDEARRRNRLETKEEKNAERARRKAERQRWIDEMNRRVAEERTRQEEREARRRWDRENRKRTGEPPVAEEPPAPEAPREPPVAPAEALGEPEVLDPREPGAQKEEPEIFDADVVEDLPQIEASKGPEGPEIPELRLITGEGQTDDTEWSVYGKPKLHAVTDQESGEDMTTMYEGKDQSANGTLPAAGASGGTVAVEGGISAHIRWTADVADYQGRAASHVEIVWASMFHGENGPERLAKINRILEMHQQLAAAYWDLNEILVGDRNTIGDAYAATGNQAGGKPYVTS